MIDNREYPKVLLVSDATWADDNNIGNTFSNLFGNWDGDKLAMIYARADLPNNSLCNKYFQISENRLLKRLIDKNVKTGVVIDSVEAKKPKDIIEDEEEGRKLYSFFKRYRLNIFLIARNTLWRIGNWKTRELDEFIDDFKPDAIVMLACKDSYMNHLQQYIVEKSGVNAALYFVDDIYSTKHFSLSPLFWIHTFSCRSAIRKTVDACEKIYTIVPKQKREYDRLLEVETDIINKGGHFGRELPEPPTLNDPIKLIFTGNIFAGRWETLGKIGQALDNINKDKVKGELYIYSQNELDSKMKKAFDEAESLKFMGGIPAEKVREVQEDGDILLHVESFNLRDKLDTRLSFSTKIVDYFERRRCILAIGWSEAASIEYLVENDAAVVVDDLDKLEETLRKLLDNKSLILDYGERGWLCGQDNHKIEDIREKIYCDIEKLIKG